MRNTTLCKLHKVSKGLSTDVKKCWPAYTCFVRHFYQMLQNPEKKTLLLSQGVYFINTYHVTVSLSNRNNPLALGANNSNLPRILQIFGEVFVNDVLSDNEASRKRVLSIIRQIQVRITIDMNKVCCIKQKSTFTNRIHLFIYLTTVYN